MLAAVVEEVQFRSQSHPGWNHGDERVKNTLGIVFDSTLFKNQYCFSA